MGMSLGRKVVIGTVVAGISALLWGHFSNDREHEDRMRELDGNQRAFEASHPSPVEVVTYNEWMKSGARMSWPMPPGTYRVHLTASGNGAIVTWVGASCASGGQRSSYDVTCDVGASAQLVIENPSTCAVCDDRPTSVSLSVTRTN